MPTPFTIKNRALPEQSIDLLVEGHVFYDGGPPPGPWLSHLVLRRKVAGSQARLIGLGRDELGALLRFVAEHDPDLYQRSGVAGNRARGRTTS
jgi:hypothetical protein